MSEQEPRYTQFSGFARLLFDELNVFGLVNVADQRLPNRVEVQRQIDLMVQQLVAQRAYDFLLHSMHHLDDLQPRRTILTDEEQEAYLQELLADIPDMTQWPVEVAP